MDKRDERDLARYAGILIPFILCIHANSSLPAGRAVAAGDGDVPHVAVGRSAVPVVLPGLDLDHVAHAHVMLLGLVGHDAVADRDHQDLIAVRQAIPRFTLPLLSEDEAHAPEVGLGAIVDRLHHTARYNQEARYDGPPPEPAFEGEVGEWVKERVAGLV